MTENIETCEELLFAHLSPTWKALYLSKPFTYFVVLLSFLNYLSGRQSLLSPSCRQEDGGWERSYLPMMRMTSWSARGRSEIQARAGTSQFTVESCSHYKYSSPMQYDKNNHLKNSPMVVEEEALSTGGHTLSCLRPTQEWPICSKAGTSPSDAPLNGWLQFAVRKKGKCRLHQLIGVLGHHAKTLSIRKGNQASWQTVLK